MQENLSPPSKDDILEILDQVKWIIRKFKQKEQEVLSISPERHFDSLRTITEKIGSKPVKRPPRQEIYLNQWKEFYSGIRKDLEKGAVRYLCWEPDIATDEKFVSCLDRMQRAVLSARSIQALVRSCHTQWSSALADSYQVAKVREWVKGYEGRNRLLLKWQNSLDLILGINGPGLFAREVLQNFQPLKQSIENWGIDERSVYFQEMIRRAISQCREQMAQSKLNCSYLFSELLSWPHWKLSLFKIEVGDTILHRTIENGGTELSEMLQRFVLGHKRLGDPRLPRNRENWLGVNEQAHNRFIQWLSRADIKFFFDHVLPTGSDRHGRKEFWLRYVSNLHMSRPLLCREDYLRLRPILNKENAKIGNFGHIRGQNSAFLLHFGKILAIEFSKVGAIYIYKGNDIDKVVPDFWKSLRFAEYQLKQLYSIARIRHDAFGKWQKEVTEILAREGIRQYDSPNVRKRNY